MASEETPDKKRKIRPRGLDVEKEKEPAAANNESGAEEEKPDAKKHKWDNRLRQSGKKFTSKYASKPLDAVPVSDEETTEESSTDAAPESLAEQPPTPELSEASNPSNVEPSELNAESGNGKHSRKKGVLKTADLIPLFRKLLRRRTSVLSAVAAVIATAIFFSLIAWNLGIGEGTERVFAEQTKEKVSVSKEFLAEVDQALADLRSGDAEKALKKLQELESSKSQVASLTYMLALAAMQSGNITLAETKAAESIAKRERVSDSLALQAVLETQKRADSSMKTFGDTGLRSELLLRQAILADAANPFPLIELATLLRYQKRNEEALALLRAARSRLNPVDSHTVIDVTINLATLGDTSDAMLPEISEPGKDLATALGAAYVAMRKGNFEKASEILKKARAQTPPDLFDYLINDPTIRRYASEPKLHEFFQ